MKKEQITKTIKILNEIFTHYKSIRAFCRKINEDVGAMYLFKEGKRSISAKTVIAICRLHDYSPHDLNPDIFPEDMEIIFKNK